MKISFDLDDLLIPGMKTFETEKQSMLLRLLKIETMRKGTILLFRQLRRSGHEVGIYTSSFRSAPYIRSILLLYGFHIRFVINGQKHKKCLANQPNRPSKYPPQFGIDLHIDDSPGVKTESKQFSFHAIIIAADDIRWTQTVLEHIDHLQRNQSSTN